MIAPVAAHPHQQRGRPVSERLMRQPAHHAVTRHTLSTALPAPRVWLDNAALDHRPARLQTLPDSLETEVIEAAERGQIGRGEGSVEHVEVFRTVSVGTSILEDLDPYPETDATTPSTAKSRFGSSQMRV